MKKLVSALLIMVLLLLNVGTASASTTYVVKKGDTLYKIGKAFGINYTTIVQTNKIKKPNLIHVGQKLIIPEKTQVSTSTASSNPTTPISTKITITDITGRVIALDNPASKILGTHNPSLNTGIVLGGGDKYIAGFGNKNMADKLYDYVMKDYNGIVQIGKGSNINFETVASLGKNNVAILPERYKNQVQQYENVGVKAIVALPNTESFVTIKNSLTIVGKVLGEENKANRINTFIDKTISETKTLASKAGIRPSVMFLGSSNQFSVATNSLIQTDIIEMAGGTYAV